MANKNCSSSSSLKLLCFMVPLILVSIIIAILGPISLSPSSSSSSSSSNWGLISHYPWFWTNNLTNSTLDSTTANTTSIHYHYHDQNPVTVTAAVSSPSPSPSPSLAVQPAVDIQTKTTVNEAKEEDSQASFNGTLLRFEQAANETVPTVTRARVQREYTNLERLEAGLQRARFAIKDAKLKPSLKDPDYVPTGPMYHNANAFHRSYLEMEKQFKVFVYEEGEPPLFHNGPCKSIYSMEGNFIHAMDMDKKFQTKDPEKAHAFFLPFSVAKLVQFVYVRDSHDFHPIRKTVIDYLDVIGTKYPYWNRSLAADHFMVACHDWGPETSFSNPYLGKNSIRVLCNANRSEGFNPSKDVSFPEINLQTGGTQDILGGPSPSQRPILAFFAGGLHGPIRPVLLEHWENKDEDMKIHRYLPKGVSYYGMMRKTRFCICPSGYEVASPRVVEALYTGCVPVLISDNYVPPFSDVLNWKSFSVEVSVKDVPNLKNILTAITSRQYIRMQRRGVQVRKHFEVNSPPRRYDVYHMILHSVWLRRLNVRVADQ